MSQLDRRRNGHHNGHRKSLSRVSLSPGRSVTPGTVFGASATAYSCIRALADAAASLPLHVYARRRDGSRRRLDSGTAELLRRPAPAATAATLVGEIVTSLQTHGNAYVGKLRDGGERVEQLALLRPDRVVPELRAGEPRYTYTDADGERHELGTRDVVHVRSTVTADGLTGLSPVAACRLALGLDRQLAVFASSYFQNHARPDGILTVPADADGEEVEGIQEEFASDGGPDRAGRIAVFGGDVSFTPIALPADDSQFLEQRELSSAEVCRVFRVPPWIVGAKVSDRLTYANSEQQSLHFVTFALRPWLILIEQALSADRDLFARPHYCEFLLDGLLRADAKTRAEVYALALDPDTGWLSRDEVRQLENLNPDGGEP